MGGCLLNSANYLLPPSGTGIGLRHKCLLLLPAAGNRNNYNGELYNVGTAGLYWSGSLSSVYSLYLYFDGSNVYPANISYRANGRSVRCISALNGKLSYLLLCYMILYSIGVNLFIRYTYFVLKSINHKVHYTKRESPWVALCSLMGECLLNSAGCLLPPSGIGNGLRHKCLLLLPAAGYRDRGNGELYQVGSYGRYWSGSLSSVYSLDLAFNGSNNVYPANIDNRGNGFSVRCISALNGKLSYLLLCYMILYSIGVNLFIRYTYFVLKSINHKVHYTKRESPWVALCSLTGECLLNSANCLLPPSGIGIGLRHKCLLFLPAAGYRANSNGELYSVGSNGNYWSGSVYSYTSFNLNINGSNVYPANINNRSNGFSVRCISVLNDELYCLLLCYIMYHSTGVILFRITGFIYTNTNHKIYYTKRESHWVALCSLMGECLLNSASCLLPPSGISIGLRHKCLLFLPAAGLRNNSNGELYYVGSNGYYWSGSLSSDYSLSLNINGSNVYPATINNRANGFSVRCISALNDKSYTLFLCRVLYHSTGTVSLFVLYNSIYIMVI
ncbi:hypothetical protein D0T49_04900 [Paludibacter sp. 221]|nr:hypothetical protein [Paludibacter sp. 221]